MHEPAPLDLEGFKSRLMPSTILRRPHQREKGETAISLYSLFQNHVDSVASRFPNRLADFCLYGQLMGAVAHSHERTSKRMTVNLAPDFNETASTKKLY